MANKSGYIHDEQIKPRSFTKLTRYEMETTVNFNAEEAMAVLYTRDKAMMRRLDKLVSEFPDIFKCIRETDIDKTYEFPKKYAVPKKPRVLSDKQREEMRERLAKARENQQENDSTDKDFEDTEFDDDFNDDED